ncbi:MAG: hypothetical protein JJ992_01750, partial [Planctomycetes bacterium]|nr:hypothetical protein [Planctomycetota bacterium]
MGNSVATVPDSCGYLRIRDTGAATLLVLAAVLGAGTCGLLAEPLRIAGVWILLLIAAVLGSVESTRSADPRGFWRLAVVAMMVLFPLVSRTDELHQVFLVVVVAACLADCRQGAARQMLLTVAQAVLFWTIFLMARQSLPAVWMLTDQLGKSLGNLTSALTGFPLEIGASFAAVDLLGLLGLLYANWLRVTSRESRPSAITALLAVAAVHLGYLYMLARSPQLATILPEGAALEFEHPYTPPAWQWSTAIGSLLPWNLPLLAAAAQAATMGLVWHWTRWPDVWPTARRRRDDSPRNRRLFSIIQSRWLLAGLSVAAAAASCLSFGRADLTGMTIVANGQGRLDWQRPEYGRYGQASAGMFGMLPQLVQSLGGRLQVVQAWDDAPLSTADAVVLLHPTTAFPARDRRLVMDYVQRGGSLLVVAEPYFRVGETASGHNQVLQDTSISVRRDVMVPGTLGWQHAMLLESHPVTAGIDQRRGYWFSGGGASLQIRWPARPLIVGRWGWSDPGSDSLWTGVHRFEQGERLGDLVIAAEQRYGRGRIVVVGDGDGLTNQGGVRNYVLTGRLLQYLVHGAGCPQAGSRPWGTALLLACLCVLLLWHHDARRFIAVAILLAASWSVCHRIAEHATRVVPDGRLLVNREDHVRSRLAYIDASHSESYTDSPWAFDGIEGLALTLMRSGLLTLTLPQLTQERLDGAGLFISIGPSRSFSTHEQQMLMDFVQRGGTLICTVGAEEAGASRSLLAKFGIRVPRSPVPAVVDQSEPEPMGRLRAAYVRVRGPDDATHDVRVNFFAAWPIETRSGDAEVLVHGREDQPIIVARRFGEGTIVVIADTGFAMNKNLEYIGGEPFDGYYENADFWRWLLS